MNVNIMAAIKKQNRLLGVVLLLMFHLCSVGAVAQQRPGVSGVAIISDPKTGTILINAKLNGNPVVMILDTGASRSIFDARAFGLSSVQLQAARMNTRGVGLDADVVWRTASFQIADQQWKDQPVEIADLSKLSKIYGRTIDGIVGQDVLRNFDTVQINYKGDCVMLER
jgi:predicted aspartyl protease